MRQDKSKDQSQSVGAGSPRPYSDVLKFVEQLAEVLDRANLTEVRIRDNEFEVQVSRNLGTAVGINPLPSLQHRLETDARMSTASGDPNLPAEKADEMGNDPEGIVYITAPMPSRFYRSPSPDEPPFVEIGDTVTAGEPVGVLEVMKTYNPVEAPFNCEILEILAEDGDAVEYSQALFRVKQL